MAEQYKDYVKKRRRSKSFLRFLAYFIPLCILLYVIYLNVLPFGYSKEYTISVDANGKVHSSSGDVYLQDMKGKKIDNLSNLYGTVNLVIKPKVALKEANVEVSLDSDNVYLGVEPSSWDNEFDFSSGIPSDLLGNATFDKARSCVYFDGNSKLYLPNSSDNFENGSFAVYAEWTPESNNSFQEIAGHYNWELLQEGNQVRFFVGRMNAEGQTTSNLLGKMYSVSYPITDDFFDQKHKVLAVYSAGEFIGLFVDDNFGKIVMLNNETIWDEYNGNKPLSFGLSEHGVAVPFNGCINTIKFGRDLDYRKLNSFSIDKNTLIPLFGNGKINSINIKLEIL